MKDLKDKFKRAGGAQILRQYLQSHVLGYALVQAALQGTSQKSLEIVRLSVNNKMLGRLRKKNRAYIQEYLEKERAEAGTKHRERTRSQEIWMLWLDGEDKAPAIVKRCIASVRAAFPDRTVHVLTEDNYREYAKFPAFIQEKIDSGQITKTHMSDLLRLELLIRYGGRTCPENLELVSDSVYAASDPAPDESASVQLLVQTYVPGGLLFVP